jgi:hypothetical protein
MKRLRCAVLWGQIVRGPKLVIPFEPEQRRGYAVREIAWDEDPEGGGIITQSSLDIFLCVVRFWWEKNVQAFQRESWGEYDPATGFTGGFDWSRKGLVVPVSQLSTLNSQPSAE